MYSFCIRKIALLSVLFVVLSACQKKAADTQQTAVVETQEIRPSFNADSAYFYVKRQVDFGPRTPNSDAHRLCGDFLEKTLQRFGATVSVQTPNLKAFDGKILHAKNIIASFNVEQPSRILLLAHWDCRPWSDNDKSVENQQKPVAGANDGASGVGVLLEVARQLSVKLPTVGVDILLTDMEDYGEPKWHEGERSEDSWCLGTQYWANNPHVPGYSARFGILLDMVGAPTAIFPKEQYSMQYAPHIVAKVWEKAKQLGYANKFVDKNYGGITDDHVPVNRIAGIPTIDIIHLDENGFGAYWHTQNDTMENIDAATLASVGETVLAVIYNENP